MKRKERPGHCFIGYDYAEDKCRDVECNFKELCRKLGNIDIFMRDSIKMSEPKEGNLHLITLFCIGTTTNKPIFEFLTMKAANFLY